MTNGLPIRFWASALALLIATASVRANAADAPASAEGDLWETTSQMTVPGMPMQMPAQKTKVCSAKNWREPPGANGQRNCRNSPMQAMGNKVTWTVQCTGPTMTGVGEVTRDGTDSFAGTIKFTSDQGNMTMNLAGHKVGSCNNPQ